MRVRSSSIIKDIWLFNPGRYDAYGTEHDYNFNKETISHNGLLIYDPNETMPNNVVNSGGQKRINSGEPATFDIWMDDARHKMGEVLGQEAGSGRAAAGVQLYFRRRCRRIFG